MNMPPYVFYVSLVVGFVTTMIVAVLLLPHKFARLHLARQLVVAVAGVALGWIGGALSSGLAAAIFAYRNWQWLEEHPTLLMPTRDYLICMFATETLFVAMTVSALIQAMAQSQQHANRSHRLR